MTPKTIILISLAALLLLLSACGGGSGSSQEAMVEEGKQDFTANCAACHSTEPDIVLVGPSMAGLVNRVMINETGLDAQEYIRQSILEPDAYLTAGFNDLMPKTYGQSLSPGQLDALIAYLLTFN